MKKINPAFITPGAAQPFKSGSWVHLQSAYTQALDALAKAIISDPTGVTILFGCVDSGGGAGTFNISAGAVYYNSEIFLVAATGAFTPGGGNTAIATIVTTQFTSSAADPVKFTDNVLRNVHDIRMIVIGTGVSGGGIADFVDFKQNGQWHIVGSGGGEPAFQNSWNYGSAVVRFRKFANDKVRIEGTLQPGSGVSNNIFIIPATFKPLTNKHSFTGQDGSGGSSSNAKLTVDATSGEVSISGISDVNGYDFWIEYFTD